MNIQKYMANKETIHGSHNLLAVLTWVCMIEFTSILLTQQIMNFINYFYPNMLNSTNTIVYEKRQ